MSSIPTHVKEEPTPGDSEDGNSVACHLQSICMSAIKEEAGADLPMETGTESIRVKFEENGTIGNDVLVKQEAKEEMDTLDFIHLEPESCSRFLSVVTGSDSVQVKEEWVEDVKLEELGPTVDSPTVGCFGWFYPGPVGPIGLAPGKVDPSRGPVSKIESCQAVTESDKSSLGVVKQVNCKDAPSSSKTSIGGMSRCRTVELFNSWNPCLVDDMSQRTEQRPNMCDVCDSRFIIAGDLKVHERTHTGENPFVCEICNSRFSNAGNLRRHGRAHTGERPYKCDVCDTRFKNAGNLKLHKRIHSGEKPFVCKVCESRFISARNLKSHKWIHTGEKPFVCDICESRFKHAGNLKMHKRIHTKE